MHSFISRPRFWSKPARRHGVECLAGQRFAVGDHISLTPVDPRARDRDFPLPGLRDKLSKAGHWP
jgi:hypothetical protein